MTVRWQKRRHRNEPPRDSRGPGELGYGEPPREPRDGPAEDPDWEIYATKVRARLWKVEGEVVLYANAEHSKNDRVEQDQAPVAIGKALGRLSEPGKTWSTGNMHTAIEEVVGVWAEFVAALSVGGWDPAVRLVVPEPSGPGGGPSRWEVRAAPHGPKALRGRSGGVVSGEGLC
jgi:hypothetical protein